MPAVNTAITAFRRSPLLSALSITTIAFSLFAFGLFGLVALNIRDALQRVSERVEIRAFVADGTAMEKIATATDEISKFPEVSRVDVVTPEQALERARKEMGEFSDVFEAGFLPASIDVKLKDGFRDPATVKKINDLIKSLGPDFQPAWALQYTVDEKTPDGKAYNAAFDEVAEKCPEPAETPKG